MDEYMWLVRRQGKEHVFCNWQGTKEASLSSDEYIFRPDLALNVPVMRFIGDGRLALHYRIERKDNEATAGADK
jgi:hypothetical protein